MSNSKSKQRAAAAAERQQIRKQIRNIEADINHSSGALDYHQSQREQRQQILASLREQRRSLIIAIGFLPSDCQERDSLDLLLASLNISIQRQIGSCRSCQEQIDRLKEERGALRSALNRKRDRLSEAMDQAALLER